MSGSNQIRRSLGAMVSKEVELGQRIERDAGSREIRA
jgi:hypothetical protein